MNKTNEVSKSFNKVANDYETFAKVQKEIGLRLFERLELLKITPKYVLDLGSGTGIFTSLLKKKYPKAEVIAFDIAHQMLLTGKKKQTWRLKWNSISGDMLRMPFPDGMIDLVFSNQVIHWSPSLPRLFSEINRIMNVNGCLMFSSLGPDTFCELRKAWGAVDSFAHANEFLDMHDLGDILLKEQFLDPVVDMEKLVVHYNSFVRLIHALKMQGVRNVHSKRNAGLTGKTAWLKFEEAYNQLKVSDHFPLSYEIVYGHAWKGLQFSSSHGTEVRIPIAGIRKKM
ncbi:biotin synthase (plasmid) [Legionella adelaidensis]|uniref:Malonyl-[acyl-carrier protein] O-methyltransferase n=2 Tax=Legionella adelaidensis TaxID=45056 RepID=A0A0W0R2Z2_9GAMM|nr:malonyl-ACP O-methyltransferase BioC [Legionella adelaidensis]KTC65403.1 biotin synthase [Legionella adelaidensis]VEH84775.1 biotin synthase [Legionella adelaidensis]